MKVYGTVTKYDHKIIYITGNDNQKYLINRYCASDVKKGQQVSFEHNYAVNIVFEKNVISVKNFKDESQPSSSETLGNLIDFKKLKISSAHPEASATSNEIKNADYSPEHFVVVFNPLFNKIEDARKEKFPKGTQAHWFYHLLKSNLKNNRTSYSYWGKLRTEGEYLNIDDYTSVFKKNVENNKKTKLYISDFTSLWVANISDIHNKLSADELNKTLHFYQANAHKVEIWFKVDDMILLANNSRDTGEFLSRLSVPSNKISSLNPYLCNLRYPLVVQETIAIECFDQTEEGDKHILNNFNPLIDNSNLEQTITTSINSYSIPDGYYAMIPVSARREIVLAESLYIDKHSEKYDSLEIIEQQIFLHYSKALEIIFYDIFVNKELKIENRFVKILEEIVEPGRHNIFDLKDKPFEKKKTMKFLREEIEFLTTTRKLRNILTHPTEDTTLVLEKSKYFIKYFRRVMLGVGCHGFINDIYQIMNNHHSVYSPSTIELNSSELQEALSDYYRNKKVA